MTPQIEPEGTMKEILGAIEKDYFQKSLGIHDRSNRAEFL